jgi:type VI secretion system protein VasJ
LIPFRSGRRGVTVLMSHLIPEIVGLGSDPVSALLPSGEPLRYDPDFEQLSTEISKTESLKPTPVDWDAIVRLSTNVLRTKSKDYRVAAYLVFGLFQTRGYEGLLSGLYMYEGLLRNFWETAFPEKSRMRGRLGALEWLNDRLGAALARRERKPASDGIVTDLDKATREFVAAVADRFGNQAPAFTDLTSDAAARAHDLEARLAAAEKGKADQAERARAIASGEVLDFSGAQKAIEECREKLWKVAAFCYESDPSDPLAYGIRRGISWGWLVSLPAHEGGATHIPSPPPETVARCKSLSADGEWLALLNEVESTFAEAVFAFDLQRYAMRALGELGEKYRPAKDVVMTELSGLLLRLPELIELRFNDSTPFADSGTRGWLKSEVLVEGAREPGAGHNLAPAAGDRQQELEEAAAEARRMIDAGKLQEAVGLFKSGIARASQRRLRFLWRLQLARLCMDSGKPHLALPQLLALDEDVTRFALEEWEPELSLEVVRQLFLCRQKLAAGLPETRPDVEQQLTELYQRLARLDVNAALSVEL